MICFYGLTAPVGIAIGMGIAESYHYDSTEALATQVTARAEHCVQLHTCKCVLKHLSLHFHTAKHS